MTEGTEPPPPPAEGPTPSEGATPAGPPLEPVPSPPRDDRARQVALGAVVFIATLLLLAGATALIRRGEPVAVASGSQGGSAIAAATPPAVSPSAIGSRPPSPGASAPGASPSPASSSRPGTSASPGTNASALPSIAAQTPLPSPVTLVGAGDIADCASPGDEATAALLEGIPGQVFTAGDNAYTTGSPANFQDCYAPSWGVFKDRTRPAAGNHDWETSGAAGYLGYFGDAAKGLDGKTWYSYDLGTWHVIVLDSDCSSVGGCTKDSPQGRWLASDLAASDAKCTIAIWHHPRFSSGVHQNDPDVDPFWTQLYDAGADVIVNGHDHDYERFAPQDPSGHEDRVRGIREFVVGTGGAELRDFVTPYQPNSELRAAGAFGVIEFQLKPDGYSWTYHVTKADFSDHGDQACH